MYSKYITRNMQMAFSRKKPFFKQNIHEQIKATIEERKRILLQLETFTRTAATVEMILRQKTAA